MLVDSRDYHPELVLSHVGLQDVGEYVAVGGREIAKHHEIARDADHARGFVERRVDGHVRVAVWEARVRAVPFTFAGAARAGPRFFVADRLQDAADDGDGRLQRGG